MEQRGAINRARAGPLLRFYAGQQGALELDLQPAFSSVLRFRVQRAAGAKEDTGLQRASPTRPLRRAACWCWPAELLWDKKAAGLRQQVIRCRKRACWQRVLRRRLFKEDCSTQARTRGAKAAAVEEKEERCAAGEISQRPARAAGCRSALQIESSGWQGRRRSGGR